jgi:hypothetical protein
MSVAKAVRLGRRRSSRRSPAGATAAATARAHIRYKDAFTSTHDFTENIFAYFKYFYPNINYLWCKSILSQSKLKQP